MIRRTLLILVVFGVFGLGAAPSALAQPTGEELKLYEDYLRRGSGAFEEKDYETALFLFAKAQEIHDHPRLRFSIARIYEELSQCVAAKMLYTLLIENESSPEELRKQAGSRLADIETCGPSDVAEAGSTADGTPEETTTEVSAIAIEEPVRSATKSRNLRNAGYWSIGIGAGLTVTGVAFAAGLFIPKDHRRCFGLGVDDEEQRMTCLALADEDGVDFFTAHSRSRAVVQRHRLASMALLTAGLAGTAVGLTFLYLDGRRSASVGIDLGRVHATVRF